MSRFLNTRHWSARLMAISYHTLDTASFSKFDISVNLGSKIQRNSAESVLHSQFL